MAEVYMGEIRLFPYDGIPNADGWHICDGTLLSVNQYAALFSLLGNQFGGDGRTNFALPDLRGRAPFGLNSLRNPPQGTKQGVETVTLATNELPPHSHNVNANAANGDVVSETGAYLAANAQGGAPAATPFNVYAPASGATLTALHGSTVYPAGGGQPHNNVQPSLALVYCIAMLGLYPSRS
jgi:microcystin-dependent protein